MRLPPRFARLLLLGLTVVAATVATAADPHHAQRVEASFVLALGRTPTAAERATWQKAAAAPLAELVARHRENLQGDRDRRQTVAAQAWRDAFGLAASAAPTTGSASAEPLLYTERMQQHLQQLAARPTEYREVVQRAYRWVVGREPYEEELAYWNEHDTLSYALLVGCLEDWARRNQPGLMVTGGRATLSPNNEFLTAVRVSPAVAAEARAVIGREAMTEADPLSSDGRNAIAVGAQQIASNGRIHLVVAGNAQVMPMRAGR